jgi:hypothetical protein
MAGQRWVRLDVVSCASAGSPGVGLQLLCVSIRGHRYLVGHCTAHPVDTVPTGVGTRFASLDEVHHYVRAELRGVAYIWHVRLVDERVRPSCTASAPVPAAPARPGSGGVPPSPAPPRTTPATPPPAPAAAKTPPSSPIPEAGPARPHGGARHGAQVQACRSRDHAPRGDNHDDALVASWDDELGDLLARIAGRSRGWSRASGPSRMCVGCWAPLERRNGWILAEQAGDGSPDGMQALLCSPC